MNQRFHLGLEFINRISHRASVTSIYRPIHLKFQQQWRYYKQTRLSVTKITAPTNHRSRQNRRLFQHHFWISVLLKAGKLHKRLRTTQHSIRRRSSEKFTGTFLGTGHFHFLWKTSQDVLIFFTVPPHPAPTRKVKRKPSVEVSFPKGGGVLKHVCEACRQILPTAKDIPGTSIRD